MAATTHRLWVKRFVLPFIDDGSKDLEVRVSSGALKKVQIGDIIIFNNTCRRRVKAIRKYPSFDEMINKEDSTRIFPRANQQQLLDGLRQIYGTRDRQHGVIVFKLKQP